MPKLLTRIPLDAFWRDQLIPRNKGCEDYLSQLFLELSLFLSPVVKVKKKNYWSNIGWGHSIIPSLSIYISNFIFMMKRCQRRWVNFKRFCRIDRNSVGIGNNYGSTYFLWVGGGMTSKEGAFHWYRTADNNISYYYPLGDDHRHQQDSLCTWWILNERKKGHFKKLSYN